MIVDSRAELAEAPGKSELLPLLQILAAEKRDAVLLPCTADADEVLVRKGALKIDAANFDAKSRREGTNVEHLVLVA
jgi:hypothetical protein